MADVIRNNMPVFLLRHGESEANVAGLIVSAPEHGIPGYGLTESGREAVTVSAEHLRDKTGNGSNLVIAYSPFRRTRETAEIVFSIFPNARMIEDPRLRERYFGELELTPSSNYQRIWEGDRNSSTYPDGVETMSEVAQRMSAALAELQARFPEFTILLVSHGDPIQILHALTMKRPLSEHRTIQYIRPGELRELTGPNT